jgi:1-pyrroline-5-carboxylate dehydrogenase
MDALTEVPTPVNEPVLGYAPGSAERAALQERLAALRGQQAELPMVIGDERRLGAGQPIDVVEPHAHARVLGTLREASGRDVEDAIAATQQAAPGWRTMSFDDRAAVFLRAAELLAGPWRQTLNAATMLGQSKTAVQAEIDAACELVDFWRFNVHFARQVLAEQPTTNTAGTWNRLDYRPLEGFVYAITPFNFTAIAGNLPTAPALMGNVVLWKPSTAQQLAADLTLRVLEEAGLPPGVITMVTGRGPSVSEVALEDPRLAGIHFTGSTGTFRSLWQAVGSRLDRYRSYPRLVGETGGKDFVLAHPSADPAVLLTALVRGAFEYQGQKCSAASRAYVPRSLWERVRGDLVDQVEGLAVGDVTDFSNFMGAVIDGRAFATHRAALDRARATDGLTVAAGGSYDDSEGWFVRPTVLVGTDPQDEIFTKEYFGPILSVHVYDDLDFDAVVRQVDAGSAYGLTGAVLARDRRVIARVTEDLRFAAGNFYINDKPTGAVVGQQPFGGGRASGTNDKAGAAHNLRRWVSPRAIKETFVPATDYRYPHMG